MPTITLSKKALLAQLNSTNSVQNTEHRTEEWLKERITFMGTDLEGIDGDEINVEIFPNRPDLLSQQGFTRAFKTYIDEETGVKEYKVVKGKGKVIVEDSVASVRPYTACAIVRGLQLTDNLIKDIIQMQEKLHVTYGRNRKRCAIGIYPLEHITLPITYCAREPKNVTFLPLEAKKEMNGLQILSQHPTGRDYAHLLEGKEKFPFFIDDAGEVLSMPPIINSEKTGRVSLETKDVFVECSGFSYKVVSGALAMMVSALGDMGGRIEQMEVEYPKKMGGVRVSPDFKPGEMDFETAYVNKYLGYDFSDEEVKKYLGRMGIGCRLGVKKGKMTALVPAWRADYLHPIDVVEDVAIAYGTDKIEAVVPHVATVAKEDSLEIMKRHVREVLVGHGLLEIKNYNLTHGAGQGEKAVVVAQSSSSEYDTLRTTMIRSLLGTLKRNRQYEYPQNLFEIGDVFWQDSEEETGVHEGTQVALALCGEDANYTKARQILDSLGRALDVELVVKTGEDERFIPGRTAVVELDGKKIGVVGEVAPELISEYEIEMPISGFEIDVEALLLAVQENK